MNRILVTGSNGQLGTEISTHHKDFEAKFYYTDQAELDILDFRSVESFIVNNKINIIINCAAYTAVDLAESNEALAFNVNAEAVKNLVIICEKTKCKLIQISTDFVFTKNYSSPIKEEEKTTPNSVYALSKDEAEKAILKSNIDCSIIRTSWLYSKFGNNFVKTIKEIATKKKFINVVNDQFGSPTYAKDLAALCLEFIKTESSSIIGVNIYHFTNDGICTWYEFAKEILFLLNLKCKVFPVSTSEYKTAASRPLYSKLDTLKIKEKFNLKIPNWKESLKKCIKEL